MFEALQYSFMQKALIAGLMTAIAASYYGAFVVQRGMSFLGDGLAHAAFGGVALALLLGQEPLWVAVPFTIIVAVLITYVRDRTGLASDTVIGIFFAISMALGIVFLSRIPTYSTDAFHYLFGSILGIATSDIWAAIVVLALIVITLKLWPRWAYATIDRDAALADRIPVVFDDYLLSVLIAVTVVVSAKIIGIVLISAFLVIPAASARLVSRRFLGMTVISVLIGSLTVVIGLLGSYQFDLPSGAVIILTQAVVFVVCLVVSIVSVHKRYNHTKRC